MLANSTQALYLQEGETAEFLREICTTKDPKIMVHPVVVMVSDTLQLARSCSSTSVLFSYLC